MAQMKPRFYLWHLDAAYHHQSAVETRGGAGGGEVPPQVKQASSLKIQSLTLCLHPPISPTESFPHKL